MERAQQQLADAAAPVKEIEAASAEDQRTAEPARQEAIAKGLAERQAKRAADAEASFREFMAMWSDESNPRPYEKVLKKVKVDGSTLVLRLSINKLGRGFSGQLVAFSKQS